MGKLEDILESYNDGIQSLKLLKLDKYALKPSCR